MQCSQIVEAVCLYSDIESYTTLAETMEPMQVRNLLNEYFTLIHRPIARHGGTVLDLTGDAMLAVWATSEPNRKARVKACCSLLEIHEAVDQFNRLHSVTLPTRIGVHCGQIALGSVGSREHSEFRAVGDVVNTTNRIEGLNKSLGTWLLVSADTLFELDDFLTRSLGQFQLKGKSKTIQVHELICRRNDVTREQQHLCDCFEQGRVLCEENRWIEAEKQLSRLLLDFPNDGPSRYYLQQCLQCNKPEFGVSVYS